ncbi:MAG TPA: sigma-70 family RNA polymerase sigma factor [Polyangiales bacterium]
MTDDEAAFEAASRAAFDAGQLDQVAARLIERHGSVILAFLRDRLRDEGEAREIYAQFMEDLWRGLPGFGFRASLRSWAYTLARHAAARHLRDPRRRQGRNQALPEDSRMEPPLADRRSQTPPYKQTEMKERLRALRRQLSEEDQTLLVLRVDQNFSWEELLEVLEESRSEGEQRSKELARLRQRFKRAKDQLRKLAEDEGLLPV